MLRRMLNEPITIGALVRAIILLIMSFGVQVTNEQLALIMMILELSMALFTRSIVTPNQLAEDRVADGFSPTKSRDGGK